MAAKRILLIEDDVKSRYAIQSVLQDLGHTVHAFANAEEAALSSAAPIDAAIIDVRLPQQQGPDFAINFRNRHPQTRIIFITAFDNIPQLYLSVPGSVVLVKPIDIEALKRLL